MSEKEEFVEVKVKVPKVLMRLLEDQNYFGRGKQKFFTDAVRCLVSCEFSELDVHEVSRLEDKYGIEADLVVDLSRKPLILIEKP